MKSLPSKPCESCGREMAWRKQWERDWESVRYCSSRCRKREPAAAALEAAILRLLGERPRTSSICPSEAARAVRPEGWSGLMEAARSAARRLAARGIVEIAQGGRAVNPSTAKGPIRVRLRA